MLKAASSGALFSPRLKKPEGGEAKITGALASVGPTAQKGSQRNPPRNTQGYSDSQPLTCTRSIFQRNPTHGPVGVEICWKEAPKGAHILRDPLPPNACTYFAAKYYEHD